MNREIQFVGVFLGENVLIRAPKWNNISYLVLTAVEWFRQIEKGRRNMSFPSIQPRLASFGQDCCIACLQSVPRNDIFIEFQPHLSRGFYTHRQGGLPQINIIKKQRNLHWGKGVKNNFRNKEEAKINSWGNVKSRLHSSIFLQLLKVPSDGATWAT